MSQIRIIPGTRFWYEESSWEVARLLTDRRLLARSLTYGHDRVFSWDEIFRLCLVEGVLRFELRGRAASPDRDRPFPTEYVWSDFSKVPQPGRTVAWVRYQIIRPLLGLPKGARTVAVVTDRLKTAHATLDTLLPDDYQGEAISLPQTRYQALYEWIRAFEDSGGDVRALVPRWDKRRSGKLSISQDLSQIIDRVIKERFLVPTRPTYQSIKYDVRNAVNLENEWRGKHQMPLISITSDDALYMLIYRRAQELDQKDVTEARLGEREAEQQFGGVKKGLSVRRVLERVLIDHTKLDLFIVDEDDRLPIGRPTLTFCIDEKSGYPLGFYVGFEPPSYLTVMHCLRHAILPKDYVKGKYPSVKRPWLAKGIPENLGVDNGKEFHSRSLRDACLQLGIGLSYCPPAVPWFKGAIERKFRTVNQQLLHSLPGTTFSSIAHRVDYDPAKNAIISLSAFLEILHVHLIDFAAEDPTSRGRIPARVWEEGTLESPPAIAPNASELNVLLGMTEDRVIQKEGIEYEGLFYDSDGLKALRTKVNHGKTKERVEFKINPTNLMVVQVYDRFSRQYIPAYCTDPTYAKDLSLWKHRVIRRYARQHLRQVDYDALAQAKAEIQAIVDREWTLNARSASRAKLARFKDHVGRIQDVEPEASIIVQPVPSPVTANLTEAGLAEGNPDKVAQPSSPANRRGRGAKHDPRPKDTQPQGHAPTADTDDLDLDGWGTSFAVGRSNDPKS